MRDQVEFTRITNSYDSRIDFRMYIKSTKKQPIWELKKLILTGGEHWNLVFSFLYINLGIKILFTSH